ncbi:MaoC/PaaZ C-terminal domain-containing protein [Streptomyces sp. NPDC047061]|uniref:MaoC/PaaZ C-terminal domain-containing protein n=1 Tax=Streptomyces sp. NPDC047061 TaxID=3154605 RepID=UPI0033ED4287
MSERYWEDVQVGDVFQGPGITVTDAHLTNWAGLTGDWTSLHLDAEYAASTPFGGRIAHGPLTLSLSLGLLTQTGVFGNVVAWLGLDEVRAKAPVHLGDTIRPVAEVTESRPSSKPGRGVWTLAYRTLNQRQETVMTFSSGFLIRRRDS